MKLSAKKIGYFFTLVCLMGFFNYSPAMAATENSETGQGLTISPPIKEFTMDQGQTKTSKITLSNPTKSVVEVYPVVMDFASKNDTGDPEFLEAAASSGAKYALSSWIKVKSDKIVLAPEQIIEWDYSIVVPENGGPGGHYGAILFSNKPPQSNGKLNQVGISSMVASLLLVSVSGDTSTQALISEFSTDKSFYMAGPMKITTKISNLGNVHIAPMGNVVVKNMFGKKTTSLELNKVGGRILPDSVRKFENTWEPSNSPFWKSPIGRYSVELVAVYGAQSLGLSAKTSFWVIPLWFMIAVGVLLLLIIWLIIRKIKKKKALAKAGAGAPANSVNTNAAPQAPVAQAQSFPPTNMEYEPPVVNNPPQDNQFTPPPVAEMPPAPEGPTPDNPTTNIQ